jgi:hypothetical protein
VATSAETWPFVAVVAGAFTCADTGDAISVVANIDEEVVAFAVAVGFAQFAISCLWAIGMCVQRRSWSDSW